MDFLSIADYRDWLVLGNRDLKLGSSGSSLALEVQWLRLCTLTARSLGSVPGWGSKIPQAARCSLNKVGQVSHLHFMLNKQLSDKTEE